ncbi:hypothetical protein GCM10009625_03790 [Brachybacterium fresconis]
MAGLAPITLDGAGLVLLVVAEGAQTLPVVEEGVAAGRVGADVIALADGRIAVRPTADLVPPADEARQPIRELARDRLDGDQLSGGGVGVQPSQRQAGGGSVVPAELVGGLVAECAQGTAEVLPDGLGGNRAVPLDVCQVPALRIEQGAIGHDHADVQVGAVHPVLRAEEGVDEGIRLDLLMPAPIPRRTESLRFEGESLADRVRRQGGHVSADGRHAVLPAPHGHAAMPPGVVMALRLPVGIGLGDRGGDGAVPLLGPAAVQLRESGAEDRIDVLALNRRERSERGGGGSGAGGGESPGRHRREHLRHRVDQTACRGESTARGGRCPPGAHRDVAGGGVLGPDLGHRLRLGGIGLLRGFGQCFGAELGARRIGVADHGSHLQGVHRGALFLQALDHGGVLVRRGSGGREEATRIGGQFGEQEALVSEQLGECGRSGSAHSIEQLPGRILGPRCIEFLREIVHASMMRSGTDNRSPRERMWKTLLRGGKMTMSSPTFGVRLSRLDRRDAACHLPSIRGRTSSRPLPLEARDPPYLRRSQHSSPRERVARSTVRSWQTLLISCRMWITTPCGGKA